MNVNYTFADGSETIPFFKMASEDHQQQQITSTTPVSSQSQSFVLVDVSERLDKSRMLRGEEAEDRASSSLSSVSKTLKFKSPKETDDVFVCHAVLPQGKRMQMRLNKARVSSVTDGVSKTRKIALNISRDQAKQLLTLDGMVLNYVKSHIEGWFDGKMDDALIEEYYRPTVVADSGNGVCAKVLVSSKGVPKTLSAGDHSVCLQLVGIQFRKQHFSLVWKFVDFVEKEKEKDEDNDEEDNDYDYEDDERSMLAGGRSSGQNEHVNPSTSKRRNKNDTDKKQRRQSYGFVSDSEDVAENLATSIDPERDGDGEGDEEPPLPSWDEYESMREEAAARLAAAQKDLQIKLETVKDAYDVLTLASNQDMGALEAGWAAVESLQESSSTSEEKAQTDQ